MSGTWTDTSGGAGTWSAQRALELGDATITFPETGNTLLTVEEEYDIGSATFYGTETEQGPAFPLTGFTMTTPEGECVVTLDDQERPLTMTLGTMEVTFTYNEDDTFNYELKENGILMYSGSAISTEEGNTTKSVSSVTGSSHRSAGIGALQTNQPLRFARSNGDENIGSYDKLVNGLIEEGCGEKLPEPLVEKLQKSPQIKSFALLVMTMTILADRILYIDNAKAMSARDSFIEFCKFLISFHFNDILDSEFDDHLGGKDYDFDKDGVTENKGDCNDRNKEINPNAEEKCNGYDDNCNKKIDEDVKTTYYMDSDNDLCGNPSLSIQACKKPEGFVEDSTDCDDSDPNVLWYDQVWFKDTDNDGYSDGIANTSCPRPEGYKLLSELISDQIDCDDNDAERAWNKPEVCDDSKDNDCDQLVDCDDPDCANDPACPQCPRPGDPPDWTRPCEGGCMPTGAECCYGKGGWCPPGKKCWDGGCCPLERICDDIVCMPAGCICCNRGDGIYCPSNYPICCPNGKCCSADKPICCPNGCCPEDRPKCCPTCCCPQGYECCCPYCCPPGEKCQGGECVPATP